MAKRTIYTAPNLPPEFASDIQRAIAIVSQVRGDLTRQMARLDQLEGELRLLVDGPTQPLVPLTPREVEMLRGAAIGKTNHQIADQLGIAEGTLISCMTRIYRKLGVRNRNEAAFKAWKLGII